MKKIHFLLLTLFSTCLFGQQFLDANFKAVYKFNFKKDSLSENYTEAVLSLYIMSEKSIMQDYYKEKIDSIVNTPPKDFKIDLRATEGKVIDFVIMKDFKNNKIEYSERINRANIGYTESLNLMNWKIEKETQFLMNYKCRKATAFYRGREYTAWFTEEIPFQDGPYKFSGLPGLIIEIYDNKKNFIFTLESFKKVKRSIFYNDKIVFIERKKLMPTKLNYYYSLMQGKREEIIYNPIELNK